MPIRGEAVQVQILAVGRRGLQDHLELVEMLQAGWGCRHSAHRSDGATAGHRRPSTLGAERAQSGRRMKGAGAHFEIGGCRITQPCAAQ